MAEIFSLSKARKAKARDADAKQAQQNRLLFGRTKAEKRMQRVEKSRAEKALDGAKITPLKRPKRND